MQELPPNLDVALKSASPHQLENELKKRGFVVVVYHLQDYLLNAIESDAFHNGFAAPPDEVVIERARQEYNRIEYYLYDRGDAMMEEIVSDLKRARPKVAA